MHLPHRPAALLFSCSLALIAPALTGCVPNDAPPAVAPIPNSPEYAVGAHVRVNRGGQWLPATVVRIDPGDRYLVHYDGFGPEWVEPVTTDRITADAASSLTRDYRAGERVIVTTPQRPMIADVIQQLGPDQWRVHYDGYGPEIAENVGADRIARPFGGVTAHAAGEAVGVDVSGQVMPAKIAAGIDATRWIVRFDGYGGQYDQVVGAERFRPLPAAAPPPKPVPVASKADDLGAPALPGAPSDKSKKPPVAKATAAPESPSPAPLGPPQVGDAVLVLQHGAYVPATISAIAAGGALKVKYDGGAAEEDLPADRVSRAAPPPKGTHYAPNQLVFIEWHGVFVPGKVLKESGKGEYKIRFDGSGPEADEVVVSKRLRPRP